MSFNPARSHVSPEALADFVNRPLTGNLLEDHVPGMGPATIEKLKNTKLVIATEGGGTVELSGITTTFGLISVFLAFKNGPDGPVGSVEHMERFYMWWCSLGMSAAHRAGFCHAIATKVNISFPGIYDPDAYSS